MLDVEVAAVFSPPILMPSTLAILARVTSIGGTRFQCADIAVKRGIVISSSMYSHVHPNALIRTA